VCMKRAVSWNQGEQHRIPISPTTRLCARGTPKWPKKEINETGLASMNRSQQIKWFTLPMQSMERARRWWYGWTPKCTTNRSICNVRFLPAKHNKHGVVPPELYPIDRVGQAAVHILWFCWYHNCVGCTFWYLNIQEIYVWKANSLSDESTCRQEIIPAA
jgi:hypothetical protein